jgi:hypothetical protein
VNKSTDCSDGVAFDPGVASGFLGKEFRLLDRYELQGELVEALEKTEHHHHLVPKVAACHKSFRHKRCDQSHDWAKPFNSCSVRVCPHCSHRRSEILAGRVQKFVLGRKGLRYVVLAERNCARSELQEGIASLWKSWNRLRRSVGWKGKTIGAIVALEVTYNREEETFHPHLNVLMEGEYFPFLELNQLWVWATGGAGHTSYIRAADEGTAYELIKYVAKVVELLDDPAVLEEFLAATDRRRLVRTYGIFRGIVVADEDDPEDSEECPDCGSKCVVDLGFVPAHQISFDFEKNVLRVARAPAESRFAERHVHGRTKPGQLGLLLLTPEFFPAAHPRPKTKLDHELHRFRELVSTVYATRFQHDKFAATSRIGEQQNGNIGTA